MNALDAPALLRTFGTWRDYMIIQKMRNAVCRWTLACCAALLLPNTADSQVTAGKHLLRGAHGARYLVDATSGSAALLNSLASGGIISLSPDQAHLAVYGPQGLTVYRVLGTSLEGTTRVTTEPVVQADWAQDSKSILYVSAVRMPDKNVVDQIFMWTAKRGQTKRLL